MICSRTSIFFVCAVFSATSLEIAAAETSLAPPTDPLAAAKRDYEAFNNGRTQEEQQGALRLRQPLQPLETAGEAPPMLSPIQRARRLESLRAQKSATRSENWLVDGVKHNSGSSPMRVGPSGGDESAEDEAAAELDVFLKDEPIAVRLRVQGRLRAQEVDATQKASAGRSLHTYNPLDGYMSKWMTPGDFELLGTNSDRSGLAGNTPPSSTFQPLTSAPLSPVIRLASGVDLRVDGRRPLFDEKTDNPYVREHAMPLAPVSVSAPIFLEGVSPSLMPSLPPLSPTTDRAAQPPAKPSLAEALKGEDDAKFFKQLKRF